MLSLLNASTTDSSGPTSTGSSVIHSETLVTSTSLPLATNRIRSRSVRMPIGRLSLSVTTTEPTLRSRMRAETSAMSSDAPAVTAGELMTSATVWVLAASASRVALLYVSLRPMYGRPIDTIGNRPAGSATTGPAPLVEPV